MIDIALTLDYLLPNTKYGGAFEFNTKEEYDALRWEDSRTKPTWSEILSNWEILKIIILKQNCKNQAKQLIVSSDWSVLPDVNITNKSEFESYRSKLRNLILNPVEDPIFPVEPNPIWSK